MDIEIYYHELTDLIKREHPGKYPHGALGVPVEIIREIAARDGPRSLCHAACVHTPGEFRAYHAIRQARRQLARLPATK